MFQISIQNLGIAWPDLLILDEPTNNLDLRSISELFEVLSRFRGAMLLVTCDCDFAFEAGAKEFFSLNR